MLFACTALTMNASAIDTEPSYEKTKITGTPLIGDDEEIRFTCLVREDLPTVPYVGIEDFFGQIFKTEPEKTSLGSGVYEYKNGEYTMTIDAEKDTVYFDFYEMFISTNSYLISMTANIPAYVKDGRNMDFVGDIKGLELDLSKYGIDIKELDGTVYLPFATLNDMFGDTGVVISYKSGRIRFGSTYSMMGSKGSFKDDRTKEYAEYCYGELCFSMDCYFGKPSNCVLSESIRNVGFDKTLEQYDGITPRIKELLLSESTEDYCTGLALLDYYMDDGGHTSITDGMTTTLKKYSITDTESAVRKAFPDSEPKELADIIAAEEEAAEKSSARKTVSTEKVRAYAAFETVKEWPGIVLAKAGNTYFFSFDSFDDSVIEPFKWSMDYAAEHGAENFIVDVTTNGGGSPIVAEYIIALAVGNDEHVEQYVATGNMTRCVAVMDKNLDGVFDEKDDEVKYDFNFAVMACDSSYSSANCLPCMAHDRGICIVGEKTPGGSCNVTARFLPNGTGYSISGTSKYLLCDGSEGIDADVGAIPDVKMPGLEANYEGFFDASAINRGIAEFYGSAPAAIEGDLDGDGQLTAADALTILRASASIEELDEAKAALADIDGDGQITANDALAVLRISAGI